MWISTSCSFTNLPDASASAEGDAMAIISDDADHPGPASANVRNCHFIHIGQGVHTRYAYVLVEGCDFKDKHGDNDDVDLYGESTPPSSSAATCSSIRPTTTASIRPAVPR